MKKRVMIQDTEGVDPDTGEMNWIDDVEDADSGDADEKVYIGKVTHQSTRFRVAIDRIELGTNHVEIRILYFRWTGRKGSIGIE